MKVILIILSLAAVVVTILLVEVLPAFGSTQPPTAPTLVFPTNGANVTTTSIAFEWEFDPDATKYWLEVNTDPDWGAATRRYYNYPSTISATSQMVTGFLNDNKTYYWRVWAGNDYGWSAPSDRSFSNVPLSPPTAPNLLFPDESATVGGKSIQFEWDASAGATKYWLEVNTDPLWGEATRLYYGYSTGTSQVVSGFPNPPLIGTTYHWRVWAGSSWGWSTPSSRSFTNLGPPPPDSPALTYPDNGSMITVTSITFQWQASASAYKYWLEVNRDPNWGAATRFYYGYGDAATRSKTVTGFPIDGITYYWRVWAGSEQGWSNPSSSWSFDMLQPPIAPTLIYPEHGATNVPFQSVAFTWTAPQLTTKYWLEVNSDLNWGTTTRFYYGYGDAATASQTLTNLSPSNTYHWRVWAGNLAGWGPVSTGQSFTTAAPATPTTPSTPTLSSPADGSNVSGTSITFVWSEVTGATKYWLEVNTDPNWASETRFFYNYGDLSTHSQTVTGFPDIGTTYYWCVWAGNTTGWSTPTSGWSVINGSGPPLAPTLISPGNGTIVSDPSITYQWHASASAEKYWLLVSTSPDIYYNLAYKYSSNPGNITQYLDIDYPINGTKYYWWVWAGNAAGWCSTSQVLANGYNFINGATMPTYTPSVTPIPSVTPLPTPIVTPPLPPPLSPTPTSTPTLTPTTTPLETLTPHPTATPIPIPTPTPEGPSPPTDTPTPTPTPTPVEPPPTDTPTPTTAPAPGGGGDTSYFPTLTPTLKLTPIPTPVPLSPTPVITLIPFVVSISVTAPSNSVEVDGTLQLTAVATYSDDSISDITDTVTWASSDDTIAVVSPSGLVSGVGEGTAQITATLEGITGTFGIRVTPVPIVTSAATPPPTPRTRVATVPWITIVCIVALVLTAAVVSFLVWRRFFGKRENNH